jgi:hypothetical protein
MARLRRRQDERRRFERRLGVLRSGRVKQRLDTGREEKGKAEAAPFHAAASR